MNLIIWLWHGIKGCPTKNLDRTVHGATHCLTCGRIAFLSDTLPKITRLKTSKRLRYN